jgi:medium-chain acyl-[acyl-carrier-protein] hydrolase
VTRARGADQRWIVPISEQAQATQIVVCFPQAAAGAAAFSDWADALGQHVAIYAVRLPGRESRLMEQPVSDVSEVLDALVESVMALPEGEVSFFGHCLGGLIAYELSDRLIQENSRPPARLFISAQVNPGVDEPSAEDMVHDLALPQLIEHLRELGGTPPEVLAHERLMRLMTPAIRADLRMGDTYRWRGDSPLPIPIIALSGQTDDLALPQVMEGWAAFTTDTFDLHVLPGGHFFMAEQKDTVLDLVRSHLDSG